MTERLIDAPPDAFLPSQPLVACACGHDPARHDVTALRYCRATASNELRRDCICNVADALPMSRR
jgi:hypothetical protein